MIDSKNRTGRTTRMIEEAIRVATVGGHSVLIVVPDTNAVHRVRDAMERMRPTYNVWDRVRVLTAFAAGDMNWRNLRPERALPAEVCFVDHFVIERQWWGLLEAWTAYDLPTPPNSYQSPPDSVGAEPFTPRKRRMILGDSS